MTTDYAGDVSPDEAMELLKSVSTSVLVDVRTRAEWQFVGIPDLASVDKSPILIEWQSYPTMARNEDFVAVLTAELDAAKIPVDAPVLFLCRSGARSKSAAVAMTAAGRTKCLNIGGGFEGSQNESSQRGSLEGWKASGLPWAQP